MERYLILVFAGDQTFLLGKHGEYVTSFDAAMMFSDILDAKIYIDKRGMQKITSVRKVQFQSKTA